MDTVVQPMEAFRLTTEIGMVMEAKEVLTLLITVLPERHTMATLSHRLLRVEEVTPSGPIPAEDQGAVKTVITVGTPLATTVDLRFLLHPINLAFLCPISPSSNKVRIIEKKN